MPRSHPLYRQLARVWRLSGRWLPNGWLDAIRQLALFAGAYYLYRIVRGVVDAPDTASNSFFVQMDGEPTAGPLTVMFHNEGEAIHHGIVGQLSPESVYNHEWGQA